MGAKHGFSGELESMLTDKNFKNVLFTDLYANGKKAKLHGFEIPKNFDLLVTEFKDLTEPEILTKTFKLKRH